MKGVLESLSPSLLKSSLLNCFFLSISAISFFSSDLVSAQTLNDFMAACVAGGVERYLLHTGQWDGKRPLRMHAGCPVDLRAKVRKEDLEDAAWLFLETHGHHTA